MTPDSFEIQVLAGADHGLDGESALGVGAGCPAEADAQGGVLQ